MSFSQAGTKNLVKMADGYSIPKVKKRQELMTQIKLSSRDAQEVLSDVYHSYLDVTYQQSWTVMGIHLVQNDTLQKGYSEKKTELKMKYDHSKDVNKEVLGFTAFPLPIVVKICRNGLQGGKNAPSVLGNAENGVHVCRHADLCLKKFVKGKACVIEQLSVVHLVVYRIMPGRSKVVQFQWDHSKPGLDPTPNYDSHISNETPKVGDKLGLAYWRSQVYLYEYDEDALPTLRPRQCLPYAVLTLAYQGEQGFMPMYSRKDCHVTCSPALSELSVSQEMLDSGEPSSFVVMNSSSTPMVVKPVEKLQKTDGNCSSSLKSTSVTTLPTNECPDERGKPNWSAFCSLNEINQHVQSDLTGALRTAWLSILWQLTVLRQPYVNQIVPQQLNISDLSRIGKPMTGDQCTDKRNKTKTLLDTCGNSLKFGATKDVGKCKELLGCVSSTGKKTNITCTEGDSLVHSQKEVVQKGSTTSVDVLQEQQFRCRCPRLCKEAMGACGGSNKHINRTKSFIDMDITQPVLEEWLNEHSPSDNGQVVHRPESLPYGDRVSRKRNASELDKCNDWIQDQARHQLKRPLVTASLDTMTRSGLIAALEERLVTLTDPMNIKAFVCIIRLLTEDKETLERLKNLSVY